MLYLLSCSTDIIDYGIDKERVLFIGDSIFYGVGIPIRNRNNIPGRINIKTDNKYSILNISKIGSTLLSKGDLPYWDQRTKDLIDNFNPDIVIVLLGTNDSKKQNWKYKDFFLSEYTFLINNLKKINSNVIIYVCTPPTAYFNIWGIRGKIIQDEIVPIIKNLKSIEKVELINLHESFENRPYLLFDNIHPNLKGSEVIADKIYATIFHKYIDQ